MIQRGRIVVVIGALTLVVTGCRALSLTAALDDSPMPLAVCYHPVEEDHFKGEMRFQIGGTTVDHPGTAVDATLVVTETEPHLYPTPLRGSHWAGSGTRTGKSLSDLDLVLHPTDATESQGPSRLDVRINIYWDRISGVILDTYNPGCHRELHHEAVLSQRVRETKRRGAVPAASYSLDWRPRLGRRVELTSGSARARGCF